MKNEEVEFCGIAPHCMKIKHINIDSLNSVNVRDSHIHPECEVYFNVSGDVSFMVENTVYPIIPGSVIITRPYEYHHCIYHSNALHEHYWVLFSSNGNERYLDMFFNRKNGEKNLIVLSHENSEKLKKIFSEFIKEDLPERTKYRNFFEMLEIIGGGDAGKAECNFSETAFSAVNFINENFTNGIKCGEIAESLHISINTLERHFKKYLGITMSEYIIRKRLSHSVKLLAEGMSVSEICEKSGFSDYSHFIALFRKRFGVTPLAYKKNMFS